MCAPSASHVRTPGSRNFQTKLKTLRARAHPLSARSRPLHLHPPHDRSSTPARLSSGRARPGVGTNGSCTISASKKLIASSTVGGQVRIDFDSRPEHRTRNNFRSIDPALSPPAPPLAPCSALANKRERGRVALRNYRTLYFLMPSPLGEKPTFSFQSPEVVSTAENAPCFAQPNAR